MLECDLRVVRVVFVSQHRIILIIVSCRLERPIDGRWATDDECHPTQVAQHTAVYVHTYIHCLASRA